MWRMMIYGILMWAVTIYAFRRGGWAEKLAATGIVVNSYLTVLLVSPAGSEFRQVEVSVAIIDLGLLFLLILISMRSRKFWPLWLTAFQGVSVLVHFAPYVHVSPWVYWRASSLWAWPMLIVLGLAIRNHSRQNRRIRASAA
jgi:hypothetical protein